MKIVCAPDSFKESMTAIEVAEAMKEGWLSVYPEADCVLVPMADGGEGTVQSLVDATKGQFMEEVVTGPMGKPVTARYGLLGDRKTAVIEVAAASGLELVPPYERNPYFSSSYGTGELIASALNHEVETILLGLGGSATNDGGAGMIEALGGRFLDPNGQMLARGGLSLQNLASIDLSRMDSRLKATRIIAACDVNNPLTGPSGASAIFGPQKGATPEMVDLLDRSLAQYAAVIERELGRKVEQIPGAGAAGGLGAGLIGFLNAQLQPGIDIVINQTRLHEKMKGADLVLTGEGGIDAQTRFGKTPYGVARTAQAHGIPAVALAGRVKKDSAILYEYGFAAIFSILQEACTLEEALEAGRENVIATTSNIARLYRSFNSVNK